MATANKKATSKVINPKQKVYNNVKLVINKSLVTITMVDFLYKEGLICDDVINNYKLNFKDSPANINKDDDLFKLIFHPLETFEFFNDFICFLEEHKLADKRYITKLRNIETKYNPDKFYLIDTEDGCDFDNLLNSYEIIDNHSMITFDENKLKTNFNKMLKDWISQVSEYKKILREFLTELIIFFNENPIEIMNEKIQIIKKNKEIRDKISNVFNLYPDEFIEFSKEIMGNEK